MLLGLVTPDLGGLVVARFRATSYDSALHWFVSRNRFDEYDFFRILVSNPTVRASLGELQIPDNMVDNPDQLLEPLDPERISPLVLDGELAQMVFEGPVYGNGTVTAIQAKALGARVATDLLEQRFDDFRIFRSTAQWTPWFGGIDLNRTYFLIDMPSAEVTMVCFTDED